MEFFFLFVSMQYSLVHVIFTVENYIMKKSYEKCLRVEGPHFKTLLVHAVSYVMYIICGNVRPLSLPCI